MNSYDVIVIGGGHAGTEAASAAARLGARTLMLTQNLETIGQLSCNPAIGGIAKGTVVREVDALGGIMGRATDRAMIQFRMLNRSKGPAVRSPRAQCDRGLYRRAVRSLLEHERGLEFAQGTVTGLVIRSGRVEAVVTREGMTIATRALVVTAGTFLRGQIHLGRDGGVAAGRAGDHASVELAQAIAAYGITIERFKTGTPPRLDGRSIDLERLPRQDGDIQPYWFSYHERTVHPPQLPCYLAWTGDAVKAIIERELHQSALYGGAISGRGPRYCPSIEDKIVKFRDAPRHQLFLEPEGLETSELYLNGMSTSLPAATQVELVRAVPGLESALITRPGYAIEYDFFPPTQLLGTLQVRGCFGLYFAGQVNGTTGYEEAAGQGIMAGMNAALAVTDRPPVVLRRDQAMIGVLIDDLVTRGVDEPYRLFTSRSEFRLLLRQDNALRRLMPLAESIGLLDQTSLVAAGTRLLDEEAVLSRAGATSLTPNEANPLLTENNSATICDSLSVAELARRPMLTLEELLRATGWSGDSSTTEWADIELKYEGYLRREAVAARRLSSQEDFQLPADLPILGFKTISREAREKIFARRPATIAGAGRIPGVSPSDLQNLVMETLKWRAKDSPSI
ncbi:MAG: tRNA uridine-5-carboxymethylaminomethyl(34) synthesis enzyme MnmG [Gemmatimonadota bacterium]|nr:tRNA uridine-5-carboxymethylaminomethyl(34) synthesis enzyme MnmG [Gemmatimonadota bacterium]